MRGRAHQTQATIAPPKRSAIPLLAGPLPSMRHADFYTVAEIGVGEELTIDCESPRHHRMTRARSNAPTARPHKIAVWKHTCELSAGSFAEVAHLERWLTGRIPPLADGETFWRASSQSPAAGTDSRNFDAAGQPNSFVDWCVQGGAKDEPD